MTRRKGTDMSTNASAATLRNDPLEAWDRESFFHPSTNLAAHARGETPTRIIEGGEGVYITDRAGKRSLDAFAGLYCVNVGYGRREIVDAIAKQAEQLCYYHSYVGHGAERSEEHTSELQSLMRISYAVFCLKKKTKTSKP